LSKKNVNTEYKFLEKKKFNNYKKKLKKIKFDYETDENIDANEIFNLAKLAFLNYVKKKNDLNIHVNSDIFFKIKKNYIMINSSKNLITMIKLKKNEIYKYSKSYVILDLDDRLFKRILLGPKFAHWNNAEIGSHIKFFRFPDRFERNLHTSISFFHCYLIKILKNFFFFIKTF
jgi:UDP-MurNAc hydroxylase